jgi:L-fuconolactonase
MTQLIADTHIHIWDFKKAQYTWLEKDTSILNRTYAIDELETERIAAGVSHGILVQAANNVEDTDWMLQVAASTPWIAGVVGWLPLNNPDATAALLENKYLKNQFFKGVRHLIHNETDPKWLLQPAMLESLTLLAEKNIPYDIVGVLPSHINTALVVAEKIPHLKMVFDHLNQPPIAANERFGVWGELMKVAALHKNFYVKISGLPIPFGNNLIEPYIAFAIEHFGIDRCFCGGDWPVSLLSGSYHKTWKTYIEIIEALVDAPAAAKILYSNAANFYSF